MSTAVKRVQTATRRFAHQYFGRKFNAELKKVGKGHMHRRTLAHKLSMGRSIATGKGAKSLPTAHQYRHHVERYG